jgi:SAM-dependent methyltransferase
LCGAIRVVRHFFPPTRFKQRLFHYYRCRACGGLSIFPVPATEELDEIYGLCNHPYLLDQSTTVKGAPPRIYRRYTQEDYQLRFLREDLALLPGPRLLDYGCGSGFYLAEAQSLGLSGIGVEYAGDLASTLRERTGLNIVSVEEFRERAHIQAFDVIHLGHILEHLPDPSQLIADLKPYAHAETLLVVDGPLEDNACLSRWTIDVGSRIKRHAYSDVAPQHLTLTTRGSQLTFFKRNGLNALKYVIIEQYWPLPAAPPWGSLFGLGRYSLARASILLSGLVKGFGNLFHYVGRFSSPPQRAVGGGPVDGRVGG